MANRSTPDPDDFPGGLMVTNTDGQIYYANRYLAQRLGYASDHLCAQNIVDLLSGGSRIMYQTYILPQVLHDHECEEIQVAMVHADGGQVPVAVNARVDTGELIYWAIYSLVQRDKMDEKLIEARRQLEEKAEELHQLSITDELTGLLNRRELRRLAEILLASGRRSSQPLSLAVLDIDDFKNINDEHGHTVGDRILEELGRLFQRQGRSSDIMGRLGGDEFVFVLPDTDSDQAKSFAFRLHKAISAMSVHDIGITVSIGLATETAATGFDALFKKADQAMYEAKSEGQNGTVGFKNS